MATTKKSTNRKTRARRRNTVSNARHRDPITQGMETMRDAMNQTVRQASAATKRQQTPSISENNVLPMGDAASTMQNATESMMRMSADAMRGFFGGNADFAKSAKRNSKATSAAATAAGAEHFTRSADAASRSLNEVVSLGKDNMEACVECSNVAVNNSKAISSELFNYANRSFSQNVELSREIFNCRTLNDLFDLQSRVVKANLDNFFNESVRMSEMVFQAATDVAEPLNERINETTERLSRVLAA